MGPPREALHNQLVAAVADADKALEGLDFALINCVLSCHATCIRHFGEDAAMAAQAWGDPGATGTTAITSRAPLRDDEVEQFFADFMTRHYDHGRPLAEVRSAVAEVFQPLADLLASLPVDARWYSVDVPNRSTSGALWDICYVDIGVAFGGAVTCIHLGYSD